MKPIRLLVCALLCTLAGSGLAAPALKLTLGTTTAGPGQFAAQEIRREAAARGMAVVDADGLAPADAIHVTLGVLTPSPAYVDPQSYGIRVRTENGQRRILVQGAGPAGVMYGGLDVAEAIRTGSLDALRDSDHTPHIAKRGIKFNLPLDVRTPTYNKGEWPDSERLNVPDMWTMEFWRDTLDDMARHRYNLLSCWSLNPFPSIVKVPEFPHVALSDVQTTATRTGEPIVVKTMTIDEKIQFWRDVMQLASDRGVEFYWFTWNVFLGAAEGKDGITPERTAPRSIEYFRASVRETIKTYPLLAGMGITAGEGMPEREFKQMSKEQWLWQTYGEGIRDGLKGTPDRKFRLIHRFHMTGLEDIQTAFKELPCPMDLSFKYAIAHMYSVPNPSMIKPLLPLLSPQLRTWLTVRNDDIHSFRWADVDYARAFIKAIPGPDKIAGFYMGPDGYHWGRDFLTRDPDGPRQTVMQKQWLSFALWGRLAYEPDLPAATFERLTAARFPGADVARLTAAWADASRTFPCITRFFWGDIDIKWLPEACRKRGGFHTVRDFVEGGTMPGAGVLNIIEWRTGLLANRMPQGVTPLEIAATLDANATQALKSLPGLHRAEIKPAASAKEYAATLADIETMSLLGLYYAAKIRGACDLALFDKVGDAKQQASAVQHLERALTHWKDYAAAYTRQYVQPVQYNRAGLVDLPKQTQDAAADVQIAHDWKPGTIAEAEIKRSGTEAGFRK